MKMAPTYVTLPSGSKIPALGLGTFDARDEQEIEKALNIAFEKGYRHIDTAFVYENEVAIGKVLKKWFAEKKVKREDLFITTKLPKFGVHPDRVELFIKKSLTNLQLDYVDLYLVHFPIGLKYTEGGPIQRSFKANGDVETEGKTDHAALWKKMEEQVDAGRARNIGISNYNIAQIETILKTARIKPANLQIEIHVLFSQKKLVDFCHKNGISVVAYTPLGNPGYNKFLQRVGKEPRKLPDILGAAIVAKMAQKYKKTPAQIALRFLVQRGIIPIPKSVTPSHIQENIDVFNFKFDDADMKELLDSEVGEPARVATFIDVYPGLKPHPDFPF